MKLIDRYIAWTVALYIIAAVFAFSILIICNNFYASSDLLFEQKIPFSTVAVINLLDAPATIVLSLPVACLFGVMLAIGTLGRSSELTAMRCGGISLVRILAPVAALSILLSILTYYLDEKVVPIASERAFDLKNALKGNEALDIRQNVFFRNEDGAIIYAGNYDTNTLILARVLMYEREPDNWTRITLAFSGRFEGDTLKLNDGRTFLYDEDAELVGREEIENLIRPFPRSLQEVHEDRRDASTLASGEIAEQIGRLRHAGLDPIEYQTDYQFKFSTPVACFIFAFVGFIFSVFSPRKETFMGMLYAIILVLVYYVFISVFKSLGKQGIIPYPFISAWTTNIVFLAFGIYIFTRIRR